MKKILQQAAFPLAIVTFIAHLCRMTGVTPNRSLPFSQNLLAQLHGGKSERISLQELLDGVKTHARATLMILFSLPNLVPSIPGMSAITGLPLLFLAVQMMMGNNVWLPHFIASRSFLRSDLLRLINRLLPYLQRVERVLQPRQLILSRPTVLQVIGLICVVLSVLIALPIPLGNFLPAVAIILFSLGTLEADGVFIIAGFVTAIASVLFITVFYWGVIMAVLRMMGHAA
jgi:hypothetical protein